MKYPRLNVTKGETYVGKNIYVDYKNNSGTEDGSKAYPFSTIDAAFCAIKDSEEEYTVNLLSSELGMNYSDIYVFNNKSLSINGNGNSLDNISLQFTQSQANFTVTDISFRELFVQFESGAGLVCASKVDCGNQFVIDGNVDTLILDEVTSVVENQYGIVLGDWGTSVYRIKDLLLTRCHLQSIYTHMPVEKAVISHSYIELLLENSESTTHYNDYTVYNSVICNRSSRYSY